MHLYDGYFRGPTHFRGVSKGFTLCGQAADRSDMTVFTTDCTCQQCLARAASDQRKDDVIAHKPVSR